MGTKFSTHVNNAKSDEPMEGERNGVQNFLLLICAFLFAYTLKRK